MVLATPGYAPTTKSQFGFMHLEARIFGVECAKVINIGSRFFKL